MESMPSDASSGWYYHGYHDYHHYESYFDYSVLNFQNSLLYFGGKVGNTASSKVYKMTSSSSTSISLNKFSASMTNAR